MDRLFQDLRFALRLLWRDRAFTITTMATLALCVGANTAIFAIVNSVLLKPLPFDEPARLVRLNNSYPGAGFEKGPSGVPDYFDRLRDLTALEALATFRETGATLGGQGQGEAERVTSMLASPSLFRVLRVSALRGSVFTEREAEPGNDRKVVLSYGFWQKAFGGRDEAIGQDLRINGLVYTVMGVMPRDFRFLNAEVQFWMPAAFTPEQRADSQRHNNGWEQVGRLKPGATIEQVQAQLNALTAHNLEAFPQWREILTNVGFNSKAASFQEDLVAEARRTLLLLWGGVLIVLLIGCVNVANLVSVRATTRIRELATRSAVGASLGRLTWQLLTETVVLAIAGGALGVLLGWWGLGAASVLGFDTLPRGHEIGLDGRSLLFTTLLVFLVGLGVGLLPVIALRRANLGQIIREEGRSGTASRGARMVRRALVTSQVAFALILLVGAGLLLASFQRVLAIDPGFRTEGVLTGSFSLPETRYADPAALRTAMERVLDRVRALPGIEAAGVTSSVPFGGDYSDGVILALGYQMAPGESLISPNRLIVSDGYFEAMNISLVEGRVFDQRDGEQPRTIIVDERLARKFWPNESALGKRMYQPQDSNNLLKPPTDEKEWFTVIGVAKEVRLVGLVDPTGLRRVGAYYFSFRNQPRRTVTLAIRTSLDPTTVTSGVRRELASIDSEVPFYNVRTMDERLSTSLIDRRTPMLLGVGFGVVALFLAAIGVYGVLAYQVSERRREIGIRMALGAAKASIFRMVLGEGAIMVSAGAVLGLIGAFLLRRTLQSQLYEIGAMDPLVVGIVGLVLLLVALVACLLPARRAARTDPALALTE
jgi:predicted permease